MSFLSYPKVFPRHHRWRLTTILLATLALGWIGTLPSYASPNIVTWPLISLRLIEDGFARPVNMTTANDGTDRLFVVEQGGLIYILQDGERLATPFLDISTKVANCGECGLLGLAFPPNFAEEGEFYINYISTIDLAPPDTDDPNTSRDTVIARFRVSDNPNIADPASEEHILLINQPRSNHNGGHILFGPDNYLYIAMGDGGGGNDTFENSQNPASLHGKILRIEVGSTLTYTIPASNPFINEQGYRDEIWATGLRNPWRFGFDRATGDLYIADVGQDDFEEVNYIAAAELGNSGQNYGWPIMEGNVCFPPSDPQDCERTELTGPVVTYGRADGRSITGGFVFHSQLSSQAPIYLYGDHVSGRLWGLQRDGTTWVTHELDQYPYQISSFGEDEVGNIYLVDYGGSIYQIRENLSFLPSISTP